VLSFYKLRKSYGYVERVKLGNCSENAILFNKFKQNTKKAPSLSLALIRRFDFSSIPMISMVLTKTVLERNDEITKFLIDANVDTCPKVVPDNLELFVNRPRRANNFAFDHRRANRNQARIRFNNFNANEDLPRAVQVFKIGSSFMWAAFLGQADVVQYFINKGT
jgi:hypothetical protein